MSPSLLQGQRLSRSPTEDSSLLSKAKSGENQCEKASDCPSQQSCLKTTGKVKPSQSPWKSIFCSLEGLMGTEADKSVDKINPLVFDEATTVPVATSSLEMCDSPSPLYDLIDNLSNELIILPPPAAPSIPETAFLTEPEMCLTIEERNFIADLKSKHSSICKRSFPLR